MDTVVVTGLGAVSALGADLDAFEDSLFAGVDGAAPITRFDATSFQTQCAAEVRAFDPTEHFDTRRQLPFMDPFTQYGVVAARAAVRDADITIDRANASRIAVLHGTGIGGQDTQDQNFHRLYAQGANRLHPATVPKLIPSAAASHISIDLGITGPVQCTASACAASAHAIINGAMMIQSGLCDIAVAGGSEAPVNYGCVKAWEGMRVLCKHRCSPFSQDRSGVLLGEGAASLVLESLASARNRGASIKAVLSGFGMSADAGNPVSPTLEGPVLALQNALSHAGLEADAIQYINAHGSGTAQNDPVETSALHQVFGQHASQLAISSTKSMHGHTLGAAAALEAVATILAIHRQAVPPTINYLATDPECDLDYVPNRSRAQAITHAISNSFAFGGLNASLVFSHAGTIHH